LATWTINTDNCYGDDNNFEELKVWKARILCQKIFELTKNENFCKDFKLINQILGSSGSVMDNIAEAYKRKRYQNYFVSKLNDAETENVETEVWLNFSLDCGYISNKEHTEFLSLNNETAKFIWYMIDHPDRFT